MNSFLHLDNDVVRDFLLAPDHELGDCVLPPIAIRPTETLIQYRDRLVGIYTSSRLWYTVHVSKILSLHDDILPNRYYPEQGYEGGWLTESKIDGTYNWLIDFGATYPRMDDGNDMRHDGSDGETRRRTHWYVPVDYLKLVER